MEYIVYKRFKSNGIDGPFNLGYGTTVTERDGFLYTSDGRCVCATTSENGWEHFRPNTPEGAHRQEMLDKLYDYYEQNGTSSDFDADKWPNAENLYWKNLLRTMSTPNLEAFYKKHFSTHNNKKGGI